MFYTYLWLREDGTPYYAGKGKGARGFSNSGHRVRKPINPARIITQDWDSENDAHEAEKFLIAYYGRLDNQTGCLANLTDGGEGHANPSEAARKRLRELKMGNTFTRGRTQSQEAKDAIGLANKVPHPWCAKLVPEQVIEIRRLARIGVRLREISRQFGVDHKSIGKILTRKTWAYVE
jgi:hypothetical protein